MKNVVLATAAVFGLTSAATAAELGAGFSLNNTATAEYNIDAEAFTLKTEPTLAYDAYGLATLSVGSELMLFENEEFALDTLPTLDFRADKEVYTGLTVYGEVSYDLEAEDRGDMTVGASFSF